MIQEIFKVVQTLTPISYPFLNQKKCRSFLASLRHVLVHLQANHKPLFTSYHLELKKLAPLQTLVSNVQSKTYSTSKLSPKAKEPTPSQAHNLGQEAIYLYTLEITKQALFLWGQDTSHIFPIACKFTNKLINNLSWTSKDQWDTCNDLLQTFFDMNVKEQGVCKLI